MGLLRVSYPMRWLCFECYSQLSLVSFASGVPQAHTRRTLILLSKSIQQLAAGVALGRKEAYMQDMSTFADRNRSAMNRFFEEVMVCYVCIFVL